MDPTWLSWAKRLQAVAQTGLTYAASPYDVERYEEVRAIAAAMMAAPARMDPDDVRDLFARDTGYATPKVDVRGVVFRDEAILLVHEREDGRWTLPGGWADVGEPPSACVVREVFEESGYRTRAVKLLALYDRDRQGHTPLPYAVYKAFFLCELTDESRAERVAEGGVSFTETDGVDFFREDSLPELSLSRVTPAQIARLFAHHRHPAWPTDFD